MKCGDGGGRKQFLLVDAYHETRFLKELREFHSRTVVGERAYGRAGHPYA